MRRTAKKRKERGEIAILAVLVLAVLVIAVALIPAGRQTSTRIQQIQAGNAAWTQQSWETMRPSLVRRFQAVTAPAFTAQFQSEIDSNATYRQRLQNEEPPLTPSEARTFFERVIPVNLNALEGSSDNFQFLASDQRFAAVLDRLGKTGVVSKVTCRFVGVRQGAAPTPNHIGVFYDLALTFTVQSELFSSTVSDGQTYSGDARRMRFGGEITLSMTFTPSRFGTTTVPNPPQCGDFTAPTNPSITACNPPALPNPPPTYSPLPAGTYELVFVEE